MYIFNERCILKLWGTYRVENKGWELVAEEEARADELYESMKESIEFTTPPPAVEPEKK